MNTATRPATRYEASGVSPQICVGAKDSCDETAFIYGTRVLFRFVANGTTHLIDGIVWYVTSV